MRFETGQHMKLSQQMKLAPRMIQSMEILQLPMLALQERIEQELEANIALEQVEPTPSSDEDAIPTEDSSSSESSVEQREMVVGDGSADGQDDWERLSTFESDYREVFDNEYSPGHSAKRSAAGERDGKMDALASVPSRSASLTEQLQEQWKFAEVTSEIQAVGECIISYIDDDGFLSTDLETIHQQNSNRPDLNISLELLEESLHQIFHWIDPPGIGARDHRESFLLQIDRFEETGSDEIEWDVLRSLINDHYDDLLENRLPKITQKSDLTLEQIHQAMELIRKLKLNPGRELISEDVPPIIPDVIVEYDEQSDAYVATLSDGFLPILQITPHYEKMARDRSVDKETRDFVSTNVRNATWLIESINQRKNTLLRVVNVVLARQREFFDHGPQHLKPLPMLEVAEQLGIHVGTVSRAVAGKWVQMPKGMMLLRKFFSGGTETEKGQVLSWEAVKAKLQEIIDEEDKSHPLSDEALAGELKKRGIDIARRTVVKYRQQLDIPPARRRKTF